MEKTQNYTKLSGAYQICVLNHDMGVIKEPAQPSNTRIQPGWLSFFELPEKRMKKNLAITTGFL